MINLIKNIIFISFLLIPSILSQTIKEIEIIDNSIFNDNEIINWSNLYEGHTYTSGLLDSSKIKIAAELNVAGYFHSSFNKSEIQFSADSLSVNIVLQVNEGDPTIVKDLFFSTDDTTNVNEYLAVFSYLKGEIFKSSILFLMEDFFVRCFR